MDMKKKIVVGTIIFILCGFLLLEFFPNYVLELFSWHGKSFNAYRN